MAHMSSERVKLVLLGDCGVGKTKLVKQFLSGIEASCNPPSGPTLGVDFAACRVHLEGEVLQCRVNIWDTSGAPQFRDLVEGCMHDLRVQDAVFILYDVTRRSTFESLAQWVELARRGAAAKSQASLIMLLGVTSDSGTSPRVTAREGLARAQDLDAQFAELNLQSLDSVNGVFLRSYLLQQCSARPVPHCVIEAEDLPRRCTSPVKWLQPMLRCTGLLA